MRYTEQEYILDNDGRFCRRTVITTPIANADTVLSKVKDDGVLISHPFTEDITVEGVCGTDTRHTVRFLTYSITPHIVHTFTPLPYFPFKGAHLVPHPMKEDYYNLYITNQAGRLPDNVVKHGSIKWFSQQDDYMLNYYTSYNFKDALVGNSYIFAQSVKNKKKAYIPNLPNVFDDGRLCAGEDHHYRILSVNEDLGHNSLLNLIKIHQKNLELLYTAPCNNDLRMYEAEKDVVLFDQFGSTKSMLNDNPTTNFYRECTHSVINEFVTQHL